MDNSEDEADIIDTLSTYMTNKIGGRFIINTVEGKEERLYKKISSVRQFYNYVIEYNEKLKNKSCVELKKEIIKRKVKK